MPHILRPRVDQYGVMDGKHDVEFEVGFYHLLIPPEVGQCKVQTPCHRALNRVVYGLPFQPGVDAVVARGEEPAAPAPGRLHEPLFVDRALAPIHIVSDLREHRKERIDKALGLFDGQHDALGLQLSYDRARASTVCYQLCYRPGSLSGTSAPLSSALLRITFVPCAVLAASW